MTAATLTFLLLVAWAAVALWAFSAVCAEAYRTRMVAHDLDAAAERAAEADRAVLDTVERWRRDQDVNRIAREVRAAFLDQMQDRPHLAAIRARMEAAALDDDEAVAEWLESGS